MTNRHDTPAWLIDTHVHLYPRYSRERFLDAAVRNFRRGASELGLPSAHGMLCLTEDSRNDVFARLCTGAERLPAGWEVRSTEDGVSAWLTHAEPTHVPGRLLLLRGLQRVTREGLEVSALGCPRDLLPDGLTLGDSVTRIRDAGGYPVIPWGFGKWWFGRGRTLREALARLPRGGFALGDNAGRPAGLPPSGLMEEARARGFTVVAGSDPLDLPGQEDGAGRFGIRLDAEVEEQEPGRHLLGALQALCSSGAQPPIYGKRESWPGFLRNQTLLRLGGARPESK